MVKACFWILSILGFVAARSQNTIGLPLIKNFSKKEYKGGSQTWDIDQDTFGRMYFANNEGLITYDGTYWKTFPLPNRTIIRTVRVAPNGRVYVGGQGEVGYFSPNAQGGLTFHSLVNLIPKASRDFADIWNIEIMGDAVFFRASDRIFEFSNQSVAVFPAPHQWMYLKRIGTRLIAQDLQHGVFEWINRTWKPVENGLLPGSEIIHGSIQLAPDSIVFVTYHNRNLLFHKGKLSVFPPLTPAVTSEISTILPLNAQEFVMATTGEGCIVVNKSGRVVQQISNLEGTQDNSILSVFLDKSGNLWMGLNNGISLVAYNAPIKFIKPNALNDLSGYATRVFENDLYIATNNGAYRVPIAGAPNDLSFTKGAFSQVSGSYGLAYRFDEVNQALMMATNEGTFLIRNRQAVRLAESPSWLFMPTSPVLPSSRVLVGHYTGLKWLNYAEGQFSVTPNLKGLRESFRFLAIDNEQQVWASHPYRGIYQIFFNPDSTAFTARLFTEKEGLPSSLDNHVFRIKNKVIFATSRGPYEFDRARGMFVPSPFLSPMLGNTPIRYLKEDNEGNIWFVSEKKLGLLSFQTPKKAGWSITYFPELTGQVLSGFENIYPYNRENVFVASEKGIILINPDKYLKTRDRPQIMLSTVNAFGITDSVIHEGFLTWSKESDNRPQLGKCKLPYKLNSLHFAYSSPAFGFQENIEYSYLLEGYDKEWSKWSAKSEKDYTNLPNGNYVFKVKGRSNLGIETDFVQFAFTVSPPWYKSGFAIFFYLGLLVSGLYLMYYYHRKKLIRQQKSYEEKQEQLRVLHQLEMEKNEKEIIRLQNEKLASEVMFKNKELADTTMHLLERSDALGKVKEALQKLYKTDSSNNDIKRAIHLLNDIERNNADWDRFSTSFDEINNDFLKKLKARFPALTNNDMKLCAYLQLNLSSKEIAQLLNISLRGVEISRYRLRKKLGIPTEVSINDFLHSIGE